jgi:uncharacterized protein (TIGR02246 family)
MAAETPRDLHRLFIQRANAGDLEGLIALYEPDAVYVSPDGLQIRGASAVRELLVQLLSSHPHFELATKAVVRVGNLALLSSEWRARFEPADAEPIEMSATTLEVARKQLDGTWLFVIDAPRSFEPIRSAAGPKARRALHAIPSVSD